jgi:predicted ester cyclase
MSVEENKAIELRFFEEVVNKGNLAVIDEIVAANFVQPDATPGITPDREGMKQFFAMAHNAFPDFHSTLEDMFAEGDKVVQRFTARGTHKGEWMGIAPIVEGWTSMDMLGVMVQLGVVPPPGQAGG